MEKGVILQNVYQYNHEHSFKMVLFFTRKIEKIDLCNFSLWMMICRLSGLGNMKLNRLEKQKLE